MQVEHISELRQTLQTMFSRIEAGKDIIAQLHRIEALSQLMSPTAPATLRHYLDRKSYTKALAFLELELTTENPERKGE